jgi:hypothetical protein
MVLYGSLLFVFRKLLPVDKEKKDKEKGKGGGHIGLADGGLEVGSGAKKSVFIP